MAERHLFYGFRSGVRDLSGDTGLFEYQRGVLAGDRIIIDHQYAQFMRLRNISIIPNTFLIAVD